MLMQDKDDIADNTTSKVPLKLFFVIFNVVKKIVGASNLLYIQEKKKSTVTRKIKEFLARVDSTWMVILPQTCAKNPRNQNLSFSHPFPKRFYAETGSRLRNTIVLLAYIGFT